MLGFDPVVAVPGLATAVPELDVTDTAFDESSRDQDLFRLYRIAVHLAGRLRFLADVEGIAGFHLHAIGELKALHAGFELRILLPRLLVAFVEGLKQIELAA